jgi:hypothetical protein
MLFIFKDQHYYGKKERSLGERYVFIGVLTIKYWITEEENT